MTPSKETLESQVTHHVNTVFVIVTGFIMLAASIFQPYAVNWMGSDSGGHIVFIVATILIFVLASKRPELALFLLDRQCKKYGHVPSEGSTTCSRCFRNIP